jgi:UDP-glucose 4-epimerase
VRALVTGGAGFIGSHLARRLLAEGHQVVILDDLSMGKRANVPEGATFLHGDVRVLADVAQALQGVDVVFHDAARVSIRASVKEFYPDADTNFMGTLNVLRACAGSAVKRFVMASSMAVYSDSPTPTPIPETHPTEPLSPYGIAKLAAEKYCLQLAREMGIGCHVLRYFNTYGPGQAFTPYVGVITIFIRKLLRGEAPTILGDGEQRRDFVHVSDIVEANMAALAAPGDSGGIYNVGTGRATSVNEVAELLCRRIDPSIRPVHLAAHPAELRFSIADITRIQGLGFRPRQQLADRIDELIEYHRAIALEGA